MTTDTSGGPTGADGSTAGTTAEEEPTATTREGTAGTGEGTAPTEERMGDPAAIPRRDRRVTDLLAASALGVYLLVVVGATTALLDGAGACPTWPACNGHWLPASGDPALVVAWTHRVASVLVGVLLAVTAWLAVREGVERRALVAVAAAVVLYPVQIALGGLTALGGAPPALSAAHLVVAMAIFSAVLVALLWHLEAASPREDPGPDAEARSRASADAGSATTDPPAADPAVADSLPVDPEGTDADAGSRGCRDPPTVRQRAVGYVRLTKPKLWWLLCLVALASMGLAAGRSLQVGTALATVAGGVLAIGASGTFNNVLERDVDRRMDRTADRPLVEGVIPLRRAVAFGVVLAAASVAVFLAFVNALAAALGLLAVLFYSAVYTLVLKPNTEHNTVIGGAVGAFPALIGWAAVENRVGVPAVVLGLVIFLWTPAHFYNLALAYREDYERAGIPMLPVVRGAATTRRHVLLYLGATMLGAVLLGTVAPLGWPYAVAAALLGGVFLWAVVGLHRERTRAAAFRAFHASNAYLGGLLVAIAVDALAL